MSLVFRVHGTGAKLYAMRILLQRVKSAEVRIRAESSESPIRVSGRIHAGYLLLVGFTHGDTVAELEWMTEKVIGLRLFPDEEQRMNRDIVEQGGALLVVSQFTLYGDVRKGRRPSFIDAAKPEPAELLYNQFVRGLRQRGLQVETGEFGAMMDVELINDGPVTILLERDAGRE
ncbi:MAG TPA: D-aminoacyl-tRNA deacylase [Gemmatimonas sp.]